MYTYTCSRIHTRARGSANCNKRIVVPLFYVCILQWTLWLSCTSLPLFSIRSHPYLSNNVQIQPMFREGGWVDQRSVRIRNHSLLWKCSYLTTGSRVWQVLEMTRKWCFSGRKRKEPFFCHRNTSGDIYLPQLNAVLVTAKKVQSAKIGIECRTIGTNSSPYWTIGSICKPT